jgi:hypothetical protein
VATCANCSRELVEGEHGFCADCAIRFGTMASDAPGRDGGGSGVGRVLRLVFSTVLGRIVGAAVVLGAFALIGVICYDDQSEEIESQNEAAQGTIVPGGDDRTGRKSVFEIRAGDCIAELGLQAGETAEEETVELVACDDERAEVRVTELARVDAPSDDYPGEAYFESEAARLCAPDTTSFLFPLEESWEAGSRTITCLVDV